jgi:hypothetical protein
LPSLPDTIEQKALLNRHNWKVVRISRTYLLIAGLLSCDAFQGTDSHGLEEKLAILCIHLLKDDTLRVVDGSLQAPVELDELIKRFSPTCELLLS